MSEGSLSLSELLEKVEIRLKEAFPGSFWIRAEILEMHVNRSGHCYLELVEKKQDTDTLLARARATIWASRFALLRPFFESSTGMKLKSGIKVLCRGSVQFHAQFGFSINITDIDPSYTLGDLARKKEESIRKLREEGVMEMNRELPFPTAPQRIAVISSETAAGYGDFMDSLHSNSQGYCFHTSLFPSVMQGDEAPGSIMKSLDAVFASEHDFDCVVMIRGGGSRADLECYNQYELAYYVTQFPLPVLTGIGHERDESVVDRVAAKALKTPTAVAEFLVDRMLAFEFRLTAAHEKLSSLVGRVVQDQKARLERLGRDLAHLARNSLRRRQEALEQASARIRRATATCLVRQRDRLSLLETRRDLIDPEHVLKRGYSITLLEGKALTGIEGIGEGDRLETRLHRGSIFSTVQKTRKHGKGKNELR
jgi:exodeoxyribonuclease VII large subunit